MPTYRVLYTITEEWSMDVEADSWEQASDIVYENPDSGERTGIDIYIDDYMEVESA